MPNQINFKYRRQDFKPLPAKLEHMDLSLDFRDNNTVLCGNTMLLTARTALDTVLLDARDLEITSVAAGATPLAFGYSPETSRLSVKLPATVRPGGKISISFNTICHPSDNILEGIYRDTTPPGCPQQYMSQCQQWGFQRIFPVFDDCTAKCTMTTTIEADAAYRQLISNGNACRKTNPDGIPVLKPGDPTRKIMRFENRIPMAPYLFLVCVGTWDTLEDEVIYPSGRRIRLEYLVPPGRLAGAAMPMKILKDSVAWHGRTQEYEYRHEVYRTICMEKSNFGGMENTGNTTIITDAALIDDYTSDSRIEYAHAVIIHEFEHNQCGSDVTMETPFDMWLNEAFTVHVERQYMRHRFDPVSRRLEEVDSMRAPLLGPLAVEDGGQMGNIVRDGFNDPDELVDGVTYVKAAEVIRMLALLIGPDAFRRAKNTYFERYQGANANTDQFFECFEQASGRDLRHFKQEWLYSIGYPEISAAYRYNSANRSLTVTFTQERSGKGGLFHVPLDMAAVDSEGSDIPGTAGIVEITGPSLEKTFENIPEPAFVSFNRSCSFYGTFTDRSATRASLMAAIRSDPDYFNRMEAMRALTDIERSGLVRDINAAVRPDWIAAYRDILASRSIPPGRKAYFLRIDEQSLDRTLAVRYRERYLARRKLLRTLAAECWDDLLAAFHAVDTYAHEDQPGDGLEARSLKAVLLRVIIESDRSDAWQIAESHFHRAWNITDKTNALLCVNLSAHPQRRTLLEKGFDLWHEHLSAYAAYLRIASSGIHDDVFEIISTEESRPGFDIRHPSHARSLYMPMAGNNKILWTGHGIAWLADTVIRLAGINQYTANSLLAAFQQVRNLEPDLQAQVLAALQRMRENITPAAAPSVAGRIALYLDGF